MADTITTTSLIILAQQFRGDVVRQINRRSVVLKLLRAIPGEGKNVAWVPESGSSEAAEAYSEGADTANFGGDGQASATLAWGLYRKGLHVSKLAKDTARTTATPMGNKRLWARAIVNGAAQLASHLNGLMYTGAGTGATNIISGFNVALGSTTNTYAGIDRSQSANSFFRPNVFDPGSLTALSIDLIRGDLNSIYDACGETPDIALVPSAVFTQVAGLFEPTKRYMVPTVNVARGAVQLDAGSRGIEIDGCVFIKDKDASANRITYINTNFVEVEYLPDAETPEEATQMIDADDGFGTIPLGFTYEMLAKTGPSTKAHILSTLQLAVRRPNACGQRLNVAA